jgi:hypothetical protein
MIGGHEILVIVEAKDRNRPPTVETVDAFAQKMRDVNAHRGVIISRKQPTRKNIEYAKRHGIDVCTAIDIRHHKWEKHIKIPLLINFKSYRIDLIDTHIKQEGPIYFETPNKWLLSDDNGKSCKLVREYVLDFIRSKNLSLGSYKFKETNKLKICLGQEEGKQKFWHTYNCTLSIDITNKSLFRFSTPSEYLALTNYSSGQTKIAHVNFKLPHPNDSKEWIDASKIKIETYESFTLANIILGEFGLFGAKMDGPDVIHQEVHHLEKRDN